MFFCYFSPFSGGESAEHRWEGDKRLLEPEQGGGDVHWGQEGQGISGVHWHIRGTSLFVGIIWSHYSPSDMIWSHALLLLQTIIYCWPLDQSYSIYWIWSQISDRIQFIVDPVGQSYIVDNWSSLTPYIGSDLIYWIWSHILDLLPHFSALGGRGGVELTAKKPSRGGGGSFEEERRPTVEQTNQHGGVPLP